MVSIPLVNCSRIIVYGIPITIHFFDTKFHWRGSRKTGSILLRITPQSIGSSRTSLGSFLRPVIAPLLVESEGSLPIPGQNHGTAGISPFRVGAVAGYTGIVMFYTVIVIVSSNLQLGIIRGIG